MGGLTRCKLLSQCFCVVAAHIWFFRMSAEWFCRSDQLQSMANSNPALLWTLSECRLVEQCWSVIQLNIQPDIYMLYLLQNLKHPVFLGVTAPCFAIIITISHSVMHTSNTKDRCRITKSKCKVSFVRHTVQSAGQ